MADEKRKDTFAARAEAFANATLELYRAKKSGNVKGEETAFKACQAAEQAILEKLEQEKQQMNDRIKMFGGKA